MLVHLDFVSSDNIFPSLCWPAKKQTGISRPGVRAFISEKYTNKSLNNEGFHLISFINYGFKVSPMMISITLTYSLCDMFSLAAAKERTLYQGYQEAVITRPSRLWESPPCEQHLSHYSLQRKVDEVYRSCGVSPRNC